MPNAFGPMFGGAGSPASGLPIDWKNLRDMMNHQGAYAPNAAGAGAGANFPLSGPAGPSTFTPSPMPNIPFMPPVQVGPQSIPRGGNLGFPSMAPAGPSAPAPLMPQFGSSYQTPMQVAVNKTAAAQPYNPGLFNFGMGLMQKGGSPMAGMAGPLGQFMASRGMKI
jgi:hypothetical protein